jgi:hypothetical protein
VAGLKTVPTKASVAKFLESVSDEGTRRDCRALVKMMSNATGARPRMWGPSIMGFGDYRYTYPDGREMAWFRAGFSPRRKDLTLYLLGGVAGREAILRRMGKHKTGKSCLHIRRLADVNTEALQELIERSLRELEKRP